MMNQELYLGEAKQLILPVNNPLVQALIAADPGTWTATCVIGSDLLGITAATYPATFATDYSSASYELLGSEFTTAGWWNVELHVTNGTYKLKSRVAVKILAAYT